MFVCIEGIDACGKTTQSTKLAERMGAKLYQFPDYETPMGRVIKAHLHKQWSATLHVDGPGPEEEKALNAMVFQAVQLANRMEHAVGMAKLLAQSKNIVTARYWPSGVVYGGADGLDPQYLKDIQSSLPMPDIHILLDIEPDVSAQRRPERRDRYEQQEGLMHEVSRRYRALWHEMAHSQGRLRWVVIKPSSNTFEETAAEIDSAIGKLNFSSER